MGPTLSQLLARSGFGRSILRPLLRTEVGEVANRRAWYQADRLTPKVGLREHPGVGGEVEFNWQEVGLSSGAVASIGPSLLSCAYASYAPP
jgi:hypothetical protein